MIRSFVHGNLGADCEVKTSPKGATYLTFSVASTDGETTTWVGCTIFDAKMIEFNRDKLVKGARVEVYGRQRQTTNDKGTYVNLIVLDVVSCYAKQGASGGTTPVTAKVRAGVKAPIRGDANEDDDGDPFLKTQSE